MEKKLNRGPTNSSRSSPGTDVKKVLDVAARQGPRTAVRRREPPIPKVADAFRKQHQPQKNGKVSDKRPKPRGMYYSGVVPRSEETGLEEFEEPEFGSVFSPGSKKQSLNHLLRFSLPPRTVEEHSQLNYGGKKSTIKKHKYNKEHFVQATCQFIVKEGGDYSHYLNDPDVLVDWNLIEQVRQHVSDETTCPICLYPPKAAKMTQCGHVYCWPCILHHINLSEENKTKCPICHDHIKTDDLRSVVLVPHKAFQVSDTITFKLMKKPRNSLTAYPADAEIDNSIGLCNFSDCNENNSNNKLFLASAQNVLDLIEKEDAELKQLLEEDISATEAPFIEQAVQILHLRKNDTLTHCLSTMKLSNETVGMDETDNSSPDSIDSDASSNKCSYFYQAEDGQHIYLHAMNAKMLEHSYGSLELAPKTVTGRILQLEGESITEELRHRMRYLQHLPVTCPFEVAEIHLHEPIVKKETLEYFQVQIEKRKKKRQRQAKEDKKRAKRIEAEENKKMGRSEPPDFSLESDGFPDVNVSHDMFPEFLDKKRRTESESKLPSFSEGSSSDLTPPKPLSTSLDNTYGGPSFASMVTSERRSIWPTLKGNVSPGEIRTATSFGKASNTKDGGETRRKRRDSEGEQDFDVVPNYNVNLGDVIAQGLVGNLENRCEEEDSNASGKKKKKKNKHKLVFSNHMVFPAK